VPTPLMLIASLGLTGSLEPGEPAPAYLDPSGVVAHELHHGRPRRAVLAMGPIDPSARDLLLAQAQAMLGDDSRLFSLDPTGPATILLQADRMLDQQKSPEALEVLTAARAQLDPIDFASRASRAMEVLARFDDAVALLEPLVPSLIERWTAQNTAGFGDDPPKLTLAAECVERHARLTRAFASDPKRHETVLAMYVAAYDRLDLSYWPARVAAARFLLAHDNAGEAAEELAQANAINPRDPQLNWLFARLAIEERRDPAAARRAIQSIRESDPDRVEIALIEARCLLLERRFSDARALLDAARAVHPGDLRVEAWLAAVQKLLGDEAGFEATVKRIDAIAPGDPSPFASAGEVLAGFYDHFAAIPLFEQAKQRAPWWTQPRHALGHALMFEGELDRARAELDEAYAIDPFNVTTVNYLRVLEEMTAYKSFEGERVSFRFSERDHPVVPLVIAPIVDEIFADLCEEFRFTPDRRPVVEVMADKDAFSVRTAGIPGLETFGASLGRVMTVMAPRRDGGSGPFNWYRVIRHEFVHTFNLMYTRGRVPRWLTEGLATWQEDVPYRFPWVPREFARRAMADELPGPSELVEMLIRPKNPRDGEIAYNTAAWMSRYIDETLGRDAIIELLDAYRDGLDDASAFRRATGRDIEVFKADFVAWVKQQVGTWGFDDATEAEVESIQRRADELVQARDFETALTAWSEILAKQPHNLLAHQRLAGIYLRLGRGEEALPHLKATLPIELQDNRFARRIATIHEQLGQTDEAMTYADMAVKIDPYDPAAHELRAQLLDALGRPSEAEVARQLAGLLR
jgi:tetratricopeptide (TPR) repeat protein